MSEVHRLPEWERIEREASEWLARLNADDVSSEDRTRFEDWRSSHPLNARSYDSLLKTWNRFTAAGPLVRAVSFGHSMNEATMPRSHRWRWVAAAAAIVLLAAAPLYMYSVQRPPDQVLQTAIGEHATITLSDGSTLELNSNSRARVSYSRRSRLIHLDRGEGYFKVMHDEVRPFWVTGGGSWVRAVGTQFDVYLRRSDVRVTVSEGVVKVGKSPEALAATSVSAGQQVDIGATTAVLRALSAADLTRSVAWRSGALYFENRPLGEVLEELERYTSLQMTITDGSLRKLPVGGTFQANPQGAEVLLDMLRDGLGLRVRRENDHVYISRAAGT